MNTWLLLGAAAGYFATRARRNPDLPEEIVVPRAKKDIVIKLTYEPFTVGAFAEGLQTHHIAVAHPKTKREKDYLRYAGWKKDKRFDGWVKL